MAAPIFDFSPLTPEERIELAEQLWDSLDPAVLTSTAEQAAELRRRRQALEADGSLGQPWREALDELETHGA
jgi:putative addiction module component (TIGR02574 family)